MLVLQCQDTSILFYYLLILGLADEEASAIRHGSMASFLMVLLVIHYIELAIVCRILVRKVLAVAQFLRS